MKLLKRANTQVKKFVFSLFFQDLYLDAQAKISDVESIPLVIVWERGDHKVSTKKAHFLNAGVSKVSEQLQMSLSLYQEGSGKY